MKRTLALALVLAPTLATAHMGGVPTTAWFTLPAGVGHVVDEAFTFAWTDFDDYATTEITTLDFFYSAYKPPTYRMGGKPIGLDGTPIVKAILESDLTNTWEWDVSTVPSGSYFLYSVAHDPPFEMLAFSKGVITVAHEGDPVHPAVLLTEPDGDMDISRVSYEIRWEAFDPDETGTVRLEATRALDGTEPLLLAEGLDPAAGAFVWVTTGLEKGDWMVRATIEDERGLSHAAWGHFFVRVAAPLDQGTGGSGGSAGGSAGGAGGSGGGEAGAGGAGGAGGSDSAPGGEGGGKVGSGKGGGCASASGSLVGTWLVLAVALLLHRTRG